jgi:Ring finger domain
MSLPNSSDIEASKVDDSESEESTQSVEAKIQEYKSPHNLEYTMSSRDLADLEPKEPNFKAMINDLDSKYSTYFKKVLSTKEQTQTITIRLPGPINNKHDAMFQPPAISFNRITKLYSIVSIPVGGDPLSDMKTEYSAHNFHICVHCKKLKNAFSRFILLLNKIYYCKACGRYAWTSDWSLEHEMCVRCMLEECLYFSSSKSYNCTICQQQGKRMHVTRCNHHFHRKCLAEYLLKNTHLPGKCPNCRTILDEDEDSLVDE